MDWNNKVVLITGASSGIGEALARAVAQRGGRVSLLARRAERLNTLVSELDAGGSGPRALACACDITRDGDLERATEKTLETFGQIDVVIANAGYGVQGRFPSLTLDDFRAQFETNVFGALRTVYATLPALKSSRGSLALVGSVSSHLSAPNVIPYSMSKYAVRALAEGLRAELRAHGVRVTHIAPGFIESEIRLADSKGQKHEGGKDPIPAWLVMPAREAAREILDAIARNEAERVLTYHGKFGVWLSRRFPRALGLLLGLAGQSKPIKQ